MPPDVLSEQIRWYQIVALLSCDLRSHFLVLFDVFDAAFTWKSYVNLFEFISSIKHTRHSFKIKRIFELSHFRFHLDSS